MAAQVGANDSPCNLLNSLGLSPKSADAHQSRHIVWPAPEDRHDSVFFLRDPRFNKKTTVKDW